MAITYQQIIRDALVGANVLAENRPASASQLQDGIRILNDMLLDWQENDGLDLGFYPQTDGTKNVAIPRRAENAVRLALTVRFFSEYKVPPDEATIALADNAFSRLENMALQDVPEVNFSGMPMGDAKRRGGIVN